ncbi:Ku protein [Streptomyces agglomeratus]|uniref:non-homologous end joining protein Ku n=1 Tax=Streptomyces agglomeratus TaxID=285458 RepID=UPI000854256A|nr:Ku protein [Streptomyces agglomeratus]OEJ21970.1 Ku protein [Streptomyces agglomeratus]
MPRPIWSGAISFGLVTIPCRVLSATENHSIAFRQFHEADGGRIRYQKVCELDGQVVHQGEIGRGYEISRDTIIEVTDAELDSMPLPTAKAIEIVAFVPAESIDPVRIGDSYYLAADGAVAAKPYVLLRQALERSSKVAVAKYAWHNRERLGLLRIKEDAIVLHSLKWPDEIRSPESLLPKPVPVADEEIEAAVDLMEAMAVEDLSGFRDHYREALEDLIRAKAEGAKPQGAQPEPAAAPVVDLMSALLESVESARQARGEDQDGAGGDAASVHDMAGHVERKAANAPAKKSAKAPGKKSAAKKTTGRKSSA